MMGNGIMVSPRVEKKDNLLEMSTAITPAFPAEFPFVGCAL
jgi:hypothetical protein